MAAVRTSAAQPTEGRGGAGRASAARTGEIRIGFVPLLDAVPLIAAHDLGYFADESQLIRSFFGTLADALDTLQKDRAGHLAGQDFGKRAHLPRLDAFAHRAG